MEFSTLEIIFQIIAFLFAISIHESAHAWSAYQLGDDTASLMGRISLNPIRHIDPVGTILLPLMAAITHVPLLGWAKPTPVNLLRLRNRIRDNALIAAMSGSRMVPTGSMWRMGLSEMRPCRLAVSSPSW